MTAVRAPVTPLPRFDHRVATEPGTSEEALPAPLAGAALDRWEKLQTRADRSPSGALEDAVSGCSEGAVPSWTPPEGRAPKTSGL